MKPILDGMYRRARFSQQYRGPMRRAATLDLQKTGRSFSAGFANVWTVRGGKLTKFDMQLTPPIGTRGESF
jgi:hypothetical protein